MEDEISRRSFLKKTGIVLASPLVLKLLESKARADASEYGQINIDNYVNSVIGTEKLMITHYDDPAISDGYDTWDSSFLNPLANRCGIYSDITSHKLSDDYRQPSSTADFNIKLVYNGTLSSNTPNYLHFHFQDNINLFGNKPILFQSDRLPHGPVVDVRKAIAQNCGIVPLINLSAGNYSPSTPYGSGILTIGTRLLADLDDKSRVDFKDYAIQAKDFGKPQGQYVGDISGPNGIPDGYVDGHDLGAFSGSWLADVNDPNTW